jgi:hypothetical protein
LRQNPWRKLHLAIDENHQVLACELTTPDVGDPTEVPDLLAQIDTLFGTFIGDGAYDVEPVSRAVLDQQPGAQVVIPPHKNAVCSDAGIHSETSIFKPLSNMDGSPGNKKQAMACAILLSLPCNVISAFLATP